jgi:hypothetical protein
VRSVSGEFLGLVDYKGSGMVVKLLRDRVGKLVTEGIGRAFAPAEKVFHEWSAIPELNRRRWPKLLVEAITFVGTTENPHSRESVWPS